MVSCVAGVGATVVARAEARLEAAAGDEVGLEHRADLRRVEMRHLLPGHEGLIEDARLGGLG